jgi:phosphoribosylglycinamide formyltransferase-1
MADNIVVKTAILVSGGGTNLQAIIDAKKDGKIPHAELALVLSNNPTAYALERAKNADIPTAVVCGKDFSSKAEFEQAIISILDSNGIDFIVLAGFMSILSEDFVRHYERRIINVHPSLIPSFCGKGFYGLRVHEAALEYGVKVTGATVHYVNEIPDGGEIIIQKSVAIKRGDTPEKLQKRVMEQAEWKILPRAVDIVAKEIATKRKAEQR